MLWSRAGLLTCLVFATGCASVPELVTMLKGDDARLQRHAADKLAGAGQKAVPALLIMLGDKRPEARARGCIVFGKIGARAKDAIPALVRALGDEAPSVGRSAAWALSRIGPLASASLMPRCREDDAAVRALAIWTLAEIYPQPAEAVTVFSKALRDDDVRVRKAAADALAKLGGRARYAVEALMEVTDDPDLEVRASAIVALGYVGANAKQAVPALAASLQRETPALKILVVRALRRMGHVARVAAGSLAEVMVDKGDPALRKEAMLALADIGAVPKKHLPTFLEALEDYDVTVGGDTGASGLASRVVRRAGRPIIADLLALAHEGDAADRRRAVWALGFVVSTRRVVISLIELLDDESPVLRATAARALGEHGRAAGEAAYPLTRALGDDDPGVRSAAAAAIRKVDPAR